MRGGSEVNSERFSASNKIGYVFPDTPYKSIGLQNSFQSHRQDSYFGLNRYDIQQKSWYGKFDIQFYHHRYQTQICHRTQWNL